MSLVKGRKKIAWNQFLKGLKCRIKALELFANTAEPFKDMKTCIDLRYIFAKSRTVISEDGAEQRHRWELVKSCGSVPGTSCRGPCHKCSGWEVVGRQGWKRDLREDHHLLLLILLSSLSKVLGGESGPSGLWALFSASPP